MSFLQPSDFTGIVSLSSNEFSDIQIQLYVDRYEPIYLTDLLGCEFYDEFIADLTPTPAVPTSVPTDAKFTQIFNPFCIDKSTYSQHQHISEGVLSMLKFFIYFEFARDNQFTMSLTGATKNNFSNSERARIVETRAIDNYNLGICTYNEIQWYINDNPVPYDYDLYNGIPKEFMTWL